MDEEPDASALRELHEETGLTGRIDCLLGAMKGHSDIYGSLLMVGYLVSSFKGRLEPGDDADAAVFFRPDDMPRHVVFRTHRFYRHGSKKMTSCVKRLNPSSFKNTLSSAT